MPFVGIGVGIGRQRFGGGIFAAYAARVAADGGVTEAGACVDAVSGISLDASLLLVPSGYKAGKVYSEKPISGDGDLTFTRASSATRVNSDGLIEKVRTNLVLYSEEFDNAGWGKNNSTITANTAISPDGTTNADSFVESTDLVATNHQIERTVAFTSGVAYSFSIFIKPNSSRSFRVSFSSGIFGTNGAFYDLQNKTILSQTGGIASIVEYTNGYLRCIFTATATTSATGAVFLNSSNGTSRDYIGNGTVCFYIWGAQLEQSSTATDYIPTTSTAVSVGMTADVPRLDYTNSSCPSLKLEPQRTNLAVNSEIWNGTGWIAESASVTSNSVISPSGYQDADTLTGTASFPRLRQSGIALADNTDYTISSFLKAGTAYLVKLSITNKAGTTTEYNFNLQDGTAQSGAKIEDYGNGWYRCSLTANSGSGATTTSFRFASNVFGTTGGWTDGLTIYAWGAQFEEGSYATSYIPTFGTSVTRVADAFTRNNIYTNGLISASGGTWFVEFRNNVEYTGGIAQAQLLGLGNNVVGATANNFWIACQDSTRVRIWKQVAGTLSGLHTTTTDTTKLAIKWNGTTADVFVNGTKEVSATSFTTTALESLRTYAVQHPYTIQAMQLYPTPLIDSDCISLTTL